MKSAVNLKGALGPELLCIACRTISSAFHFATASLGFPNVLLNQRRIQCSLSSTTFQEWSQIVSQKYDAFPLYTTSNFLHVDPTGHWFLPFFQLKLSPQLSKTNVHWESKNVIISCKAIDNLRIDICAIPVHVKSFLQSWNHASQSLWHNGTLMNRCFLIFWSTC